MDVPTLTMPADLAEEKYDRYKAALESREATEEDIKIMLGYKALAKGKQLLDINQVFRGSPVGVKGLPRLAIARASWPWCWWSFDNSDGMRFMKENRLRHTRAKQGVIRVPRAFSPAGLKDHWNTRAMVPLIPATIRPKSDLQKYHILFEAEWEAVAPKDPLLLSRLSGSLYVILAAWDLTDLERAVLAGRFLQPQ